MLDIAKLARKNKVRNVTVTNGFINPLPLRKLCKYLDASNIDIKSLDDEFYRRMCAGRLEPVLEAIKILHKKGVWIELTNLLIPGLNTDENQIRRLVGWIIKNLGKNVPLHFSAFFPQYKLNKIPQTDLETLRKARKIALDAGIKFVYTGNLPDEGQNTYCPKCGNLLIERIGFDVVKNGMKGGRCKCGKKIPGVWK